MTNPDSSRPTRNARILERLRTAFGEERQGELADVDGLGMLATFLRPLPKADESDEARALDKSDLMELRRQRRLQRRGPSEGDELALITDGAPTPGAYAALIEELPRLREDFAEWLAGVDADFTPSASSLDELRALRHKTEYRLRLLNTLAAETQRELDSLIVAIRAAERVQPE